MLPAYFTVTPAIDADGIAASQTPSGAGNLTLNGALISNSKWTQSTGAAQLVTIHCGSNETARTFTVYGKDPDGKTISEAVTGVNNSDATTTYYFSEVTRVAVDAATAGAVYVGLLGASVSPTHMVNFKMDNFKAALAVIVTGTIEYTVQHTFDQIQTTSWYAGTGAWFSNDDTNLVAATATKDGNYDFPPIATRVKVNSASAGGSVQYVVIVPS